MRQQCCHRGLSLAEVLIAAALFALISASIAMLLRTALDYRRKTETKAELQRSCLFALNDISRELAESSSDCIRISEPGQPDGVIWASPRGVDNLVSYQNNRLVWKTWVGVYLDTSQGLLLHAVEPIASPGPFKPNPITLNISTQALADPDTSKRVLARHVTSFSVQGTREVNLALSVELRMQEQVWVLRTRTAVYPIH